MMGQAEQSTTQLRMGNQTGVAATTIGHEEEILSLHVDSALNTNMVRDPGHITSNITGNQKKPSSTKSKPGTICQLTGMRRPDDGKRKALVIYMVAI